jgi:hypothetical protein
MMGHEEMWACMSERDLPAPLAPIRPVAIALAEFDVDVLEQGFGPELHGDVGGDEHFDSNL